jgi:hypothetical protein
MDIDLPCHATECPRSLVHAGHPTYVLFLLPLQSFVTTERKSFLRSNFRRTAVGTRHRLERDSFPYGTGRECDMPRLVALLTEMPFAGCKPRWHCTTTGLSGRVGLVFRYRPDHVCHSSLPGSGNEEGLVAPGYGAFLDGITT